MALSKVGGWPGGGGGAGSGGGNEPLPSTGDSEAENVTVDSRTSRTPSLSSEPRAPLALADERPPDERAPELTRLTRRDSSSNSSL